MHSLQMTNRVGAQGWLLKLSREMELPFNYTHRATSAAPQLIGGPSKGSAYISGTSVCINATIAKCSCSALLHSHVHGNSWFRQHSRYDGLGEDLLHLHDGHFESAIRCDLRSRDNDHSADDNEFGVS